METKTYNVEDIAQWFINRGILSATQNNDDTSLISHLKLQKLLYYAQACSLTKYDKPLFDEKIMAWNFGPVVPKIYKKYKVCAKGGITNKEPVALDNDTSVLLEFIYNCFGQYDASKLVDLTHEDSCYKQTEHNKEIKRDLIKQDFAKKWLKKVDIEKNYDKYSAMAETSYINSIDNLAVYLRQEKEYPTDDAEEIDWRKILSTN